jgi:large subunit ribosomal protein L3
MRTGILAQKVGMTRIFDEEGNHIPVTLLKASGNYLIGSKTTEKDGYNALVIGFGEKKQSKVNKPQKKFFSDAKIEPKKNIKEFRVSEESLSTEFTKEISVSHFVVGQKVDVTSTSKGKGFSGAMKRHNFGGLEATHGVSISHRSHGSTGHCQEPGKVFKGKKMAGQYGNTQNTKQNLKVVHIDEEQGVIAVKGSVPGAKGAIVELRDANKAKLPDGINKVVEFVGGASGAAEENKAAASEGN